MRDGMVACAYYVLVGFRVANLALVILSLLGTWCLARTYHLTHLNEQAHMRSLHEREQARLHTLLREETTTSRHGAPVVVGLRAGP